MQPTTRITIHGEAWDVPRGFGAEYKRIAKLDARFAVKGQPGRIIDGLLSLLELVGYTASREAISDWPLRKRIEANIYAANVHLRASDNPIRRYPKPDWFPEPWAGGADDGMFGSPTVLS